MCSLYRTYVNVDFVRCDNDCNICIRVYMCTYVSCIYIYIRIYDVFCKNGAYDAFNDLCQRVRASNEDNDCKCTLTSTVSNYAS
jgi:hypothetical protein